MSFWSFLNHWWNLPSLVMLGLVGAWFGLQTMGLVGHAGDSDVDADTDVDAEADAEVAHEVEHQVEAGSEHEIDAEAEHEIEADHDGDADGDHAGGAAAHQLTVAPGAASHSLGHHGIGSFLGMGRVPFMVIWLTLFIFTGFSGLLFNRIIFLNTGGNYRGWFFPISLAASLLVGMLATRATSGLAWRLVDVGGRGSARKNELPGRLGVVASARIDGEFGEVRVKDDRGNELIVHARIEGSSGDAHPLQGEQVVLLDYDASRDLYTVAKAETEGAHRLGVKSAL